MLKASELGNKISKEDYKEAVPQIRMDLINAQYDLRSADFSMIIWIVGDDRIAANQMVNRLNEWMDARYIRTQVFTEMTQEESERPPMWRFWRSLPPKGRSAIFAGSLIRTAWLRASEEMSESDFNIWLRHIISMQSQLVADGTLFLKLFLHTPEKEQRKKLKAAEKDLESGWRIDNKDWKALEQISPALPIAERILRETSIPGAPWMIVESTDDLYRDLTVCRTIIAALTARLKQKTVSGPVVSNFLFDKVEGQATVLSKVDLKQSLDKADYREQLAEEQAKLHKLSIEARKRGVSTVLAFEGWDASGKGGTIRRVTGALEAGDYSVIPTAAPTDEERKYHYLWRFWRDLPLAGRFALFDRTWYGRVLVERIEKFAKDAEWQRAYDEINDFEAQLVERGFFVAKFWLHLSPGEQLARFEARKDTPYKQYKITDEDYRNREKWNDYVMAVDQMVLRTTSNQAKWHIIPANDKYFARIAILKEINKGLHRTLHRDS